MELRFDVDTSRYVRNLVGQWRAMRDASLYAIDESADEMVDEMKKRIESSSPSGRTYFFRTKEGRHQKPMPLTMKITKHGTYIASAEGDPPAILTGHLLDSFEKRTFFSVGHTRVISHIINSARYAYILEYGGPVGGGRGWPRSYMAPRPFMEPVIYSSEVNHRMLTRVRRVMESAGQGFGAR